MVRQTIEGSWMRAAPAPADYLWYVEPSPDEIERIRSEVRDPKPSEDTEGFSLASLADTLG